MKRLVAIVFAVALVLLAGAAFAETPAADQTLSSFSPGLGVPAQWSSPEGAPIATITAHQVEPEWAQYEEFDRPREGVYTALHLTVANVGDVSLPLLPIDFRLLDPNGIDQSRARIANDEFSTPPVFGSERTLAPGESADIMIVYEMAPGVEAGVLVWRPTGGELVLNLQPSYSNAHVTDLNALLNVYTVDGLPRASLTITDVDNNWTAEVANVAPQSGHRFVAVSFSLTNTGDRPFVLRPDEVLIQDGRGEQLGMVAEPLTQNPDAPHLVDVVELQPGATHNGVMVFMLPADLTSPGIIWLPELGTNPEIQFVIFAYQMPAVAEP